MDLKEEKDGASVMSFGREFQIRGPADRKPREAKIELIKTKSYKTVTIVIV